MANYNVFLRLSGDQGGGPTSSAEVFENGLSERLRRFHHDFPEFEMWQIEFVHGNNVYGIKLGHIHHGYVRAISYDPTDFEVMDWVVVGFYRGNKNDPFILAQGTVGIEEVIQEELSGWPTFRQSYERASQIEDYDISFSAEWALDGRFHTSIRFSDTTRWDRPGDSGVFTTQGPWTLRKNEVGVIPGSSSYMWFDLLLVEELVVGLIADDASEEWVDAPDYPLPWSLDAMQFVAISPGEIEDEILWTVDMPEYDPDGDDGDDGGDDGGGGIGVG